MVSTFSSLLVNLALQFEGSVISVFDSEVVIIALDVELKHIHVFVFDI